MMNNPLDLTSQSRCQEDYWQFARRDPHDFSIYTEKSSIYEPPTKERFHESSDVLVRWTDGLLYLATIIQIEDEYNRCAVKFEDGSQFWALYKDIYKGPPPEGEVSCTVCDSDSSQSPDEIVICDKCSVGYHQFCHIPKIDSSVLRPEISFSCRKCIFAAAAKRGGASKKGHNAQLMTLLKQILPYDHQALTWDSSHRTNLQQIYCYCGGPGEWYSKMLQCCRCKQWFHEACIQCLEEPLLYGDRFYIFVCSWCNRGPEFIRRLTLRWQDIAHLILFNLTLTHGKKYFDFDTTIMTFLKDNWSQFVIKGETVSRVLNDEKRIKLLDILKSFKSRFCFGKEIKKKTFVWGLRSRIPPPVPAVSIPLTGSITNDVFDSFTATRKSKTATKPTSIVRPIKRARKSSILDNASSIATDGFDTKSQVSEKNESCKSPLPSDNSRMNNVNNDSKLQKSEENHVKEKVSDKTIIPDDTSIISIDSIDSRSRKVKDKPVTDKVKSPTKSRRKVKRKLPVRMARFRKPDSIRKYDRVSIPVIDLSDSEDTITPQVTLNSIIPHPTDFEGSNNPFLNSYKTNSDITLLSDSSKMNLRSGSPKKNASTSNSGVNTTITSASKKLSLEASTSNSTTITTSSEDVVPDIAKKATLKVSLKSSVVNPIKNSAPSIRYILKSSMKNITRTSASKKSSSTSKSPTSSPRKNVINHHPFRSRVRLQRKCTTVKNGSVINTLLNDSSSCPGLISDKSIPASTSSCIDLNSSLSNYFGAAERLASGERCTVLAKRISPNGTVQYLVEWDGVTSPSS